MMLNILYILKINDIFSDFFSFNTKKYIIADDIHKEYERKKENYFEYFDKIFVTYKTPFLNLYPHIDHFKVVWYPHFFTPDYDLSFNIKPKNYVLLSGRLGLIYPLRKYLFKLSSGILKGKITYIKHPNSSNLDYDNIDRRTFIGPKYARAINDKLCGFVDCAKSNYVLAKYFEIPATGSLLLAEKPIGDKLEDLGFIDGENYISVNKENIIDKINYILDPNNRDEIDKIRKNGQIMVKEKHSLKIRTNELISSLTNV